MRHLNTAHCGTFRLLCEIGKIISVIETIEELQVRLEGLIESLEAVDMEEEDLARQFVENKYLVVSLHVHTEGEKLQINIKGRSEKLK